MADDRPRYTIEIPVERVESQRGPDGFRATFAVETTPELPPLITEVHVPTLALEALDATSEGTDAALEDMCLEAVREDLVEAVGHYVKDQKSGPETLRDLGTGPRIPHSDRATLLAKLIAEDSERQARHGGPHWLAVMLESEFRAVYADGETKGWKACAESPPTKPGLGT